jgi:hypothetical protein
MFLNRQENNVNQQLYVHDVNDVSETELQTVQALAPQLTSFEVEIVIEKMESCKLSGIG